MLKDRGGRFWYRLSDQVEMGDVPAFGYGDADRIVLSLLAVVQLEPRAQVTGRSTHDRIFPGVEAGRTLKDMDADLLLGKIVKAADEGVVTDIGEEHAEARCPGEDVTGEKALDFFPAECSVNALVVHQCTFAAHRLFVSLVF